MLCKKSCSNVFNKILLLLWETGVAGDQVEHFAHSVFYTFEISFRN